MQTRVIFLASVGRVDLFHNEISLLFSNLIQFHKLQTVNWNDREATGEVRFEGGCDKLAFLTNL